MNCSALQLPARRVLEGKVIDPMIFKIRLNVKGAKELMEDIVAMKKIFNEMERSGLVRRAYEFENLDDGAIDVS